MNRAASLPAVTRPGELSAETRSVSLDVVRETAGLLESKWGNIASLRPQQFLAVADLICRSYPELAPAQVLEYFDLLGGRIYHNAAFYLDLANRDASRVGPPRFTRLEPATPEWDEHIGAKTDPETIAAAFACEWDRRMPCGEVVTFEDSNVCRMSDAILSDKKGLRADWEHLAIKSAKTRALRRVLRLAYSPTEARQLYLSAKLEERLRLMQLSGRSPADGKAPPQQAPVPDDEADERPLEDRPISNEARGFLFGLIGRYDTGSLTGHEALKKIVADIQGIGPEQASTRTISWRQLEEIVQRISIEYWPADPAEQQKAPAQGTRGPEPTHEGD